MLKKKQSHKSMEIVCISVGRIVGAIFLVVHAVNLKFIKLNAACSSHLSKRATLDVETVRISIRRSDKYERRGKKQRLRG